MLELPALKPWLSILDPHARAKVALSPGLLMELEQYYFAHYLEHFAEKVQQEGLVLLLMLHM